MLNYWKTYRARCGPAIWSSGRALLAAFRLSSVLSLRSIHRAREGSRMAATRSVLSLQGWGKVAVNAYREFKADRIIAERNFGGAMVEHVIRTVDPNVSYREVTASRGKIARAEPVAALYEQGRVRHVGNFPELEDQLCAMTGDGYSGDGSPDRADALVWALSELMTAPQPGRTFVGSYSWGDGMSFPNDTPKKTSFTDGLITDPNDPLFGGNASTIFRF